MWRASQSGECAQSKGSKESAFTEREKTEGGAGFVVVFLEGQN